VEIRNAITMVFKMSKEKNFRFMAKVFKSVTISFNTRSSCYQILMGAHPSPEGSAKAQEILSGVDVLEILSA
jgi:hypothetical protein